MSVGPAPRGEDRGDAPRSSYRRGVPSAPVGGVLPLHAGRDARLRRTPVPILTHSSTSQACKSSADGGRAAPIISSYAMRVGQTARRPLTKTGTQCRPWPSSETAPAQSQQCSGSGPSTKYRRNRSRSPRSSLLTHPARPPREERTRLAPGLASVDSPPIPVPARCVDARHTARPREAWARQHDARVGRTRVVSPVRRPGTRSSALTANITQCIFKTPSSASQISDARGATNQPVQRRAGKAAG